MLFIGHDTMINDAILLSKGDTTIDHHVQIKEGSVLNAFRGISVGYGTLVDRGVVASGIQSEHSSFSIGSRGVALYHSYFNTTREIIIGNNVGIGGYCMIFTHGIWQNAFKGYPFQFGKIEIKDDAWLPWHVFVMPGVTIGKGSTIAGGSVVTKDVPDYCLVAGVPAKVISSGNYPKDLSSEEKNKLAIEVLQDFRRYIKGYLGNNSVIQKKTPEGAIILESNIGNLLYHPEFNAQLIENNDIQELENLCIVSFIVPDSIRSDYDWIELDSETGSENLNKLGSEFATFIRRYGVRLLEK